jgi:hypothetical protein
MNLDPYDDTSVSETSELGKIDWPLIVDQDGVGLVGWEFSIVSISSMASAVGSPSGEEADKRINRVPCWT